MKKQSPRDRMRADGSKAKTSKMVRGGSETPADRLISSFFSWIGFYPKKWKRAKPRFSFEASRDSNINRWTGKPHEHRRERARNGYAA